MIRETEAFLTWALESAPSPDEGDKLSVPSIPRRRVSEGGFASMLLRPEARAAIAHWWRRTLDSLHDG